MVDITVVDVVDAHRNSHASHAVLCLSSSYALPSEWRTGRPEVPCCSERACTRSEVLTCSGRQLSVMIKHARQG